MGKRKKHPSRVAAAAARPPASKRTKNHKTTTNPWEATAADKTFEVEKVLASQYDHGVKTYEIKWSAIRNRRKRGSPSLTSSVLWP
jgi:hypothetical protein